MLTAAHVPHPPPAFHRSDIWSPPEPVLAAGLVNHLLDVVDYGVLVTAGDGRLLYANRAANEWLAYGEPLRLRRGMLTTGSDVHAAAYTAALQAATRRGMQTLLSMESAVGERSCVSVVPLADASEAPAVLLMLSRRHDSQVLSQEAYARRLSLTGAQTRVLKLLCAGVKAPDIARRLGVQLTTVRSHITAIREKTGVRDTAGIVQQIARLPPLPCLLRQ